MTTCFFISDLHGHIERFEKLFYAIKKEKPEIVFWGGDFLPFGPVKYGGAAISPNDFINKYLVKELSLLKKDLGRTYPKIFLIMGNDDGRYEEEVVIDVASSKIWDYVHFRKVQFKKWTIYGYSYVPPTPFRLKDWERYDVSIYIDPGCVSPEEGFRTVPITDYEKRWTTIKDDLNKLADSDNMENAIFLFHSPPYDTKLDRAGLDGMMIDYAPLALHVGSVAIRKFIESKQPLLTLHGHIHESTKITGFWKDKIGRTYMFNSAHNGSELCLIRFELERLDFARCELI
ncbi:MAG: metallophosphoesterase family protein [bacterium]